MKSQRSFIIPFILIPFSQLILFFFLLSKMTWFIQQEPFLNDPLTVPLMISMLVCCVGDLFLVIAVDRLEKEKELEKKVKLNEERKKYYEILDSQQKQIRQMQHDIDNHVSTVESLIRNGDRQNAKIYLEKIRQRQMTMTVDKI